MNGAVGSYIRAASLGVGTAQKHVAEVFGDSFQTPAGWNQMLDHMPDRKVWKALNRRGNYWTRECFQALYVACWIHHPVEKGTYMILLDATQRDNVKDAYTRLISSGDLTKRPSSHLSKKGASAHEGWDFLRGYEELLVQLEGDPKFAPYLMLKCEGHPMEGAMSTIMHLASWAVKNVTGAGMTASQALNEWASYSSVVEGRAAENFGGEYKKLLKQLGLSGKTTTVEQVVEALHCKAGFTHGLPAQVKNNTQQLGRAMLGPAGYIEVFKRQKAVLKKSGVDFDEKAERELTALAERMTATATAHQAQHYKEIRVTPADLDLSLANFRQFVA